MEPPPLPPPPRFKLPLSAWIVWGVLSCLMLGFTGLQARAGTPADWSHLIGTIVGMLLWPTLVAVITWRLSKRSVGARTTAFFVTLALGVLGLVSQRVNEGLKITEVGKNFSAQIAAAKDRYTKANTKADMSHLLSFTWLTDKSLIAPRRAAMQEVLAANDALRAFLADGETAFRTALKQGGVSDEGIEKNLTEYRNAQAGKLPLVLKIRDTESRMIVTALTMLDLLEAQWGHWSMDNGRLVFEDQAAIEQFNTALHSIQAVAKEQAGYQKELGGAAQ